MYILCRTVDAMPLESRTHHRPKTNGFIEKATDTIFLLASEATEFIGYRVTFVIGTNITLLN